MILGVGEHSITEEEKKYSFSFPWEAVWPGQSSQKWKFYAYWFRKLWSYAP